MTVTVSISCVDFPQAESSSMVNLVFVFVGIFTIIFNMATNGQDFKCFLDKRIEVQIRNNTGFVAAMANDSTGHCATQFDPPYLILTITECNFGEETTVVLSSRNFSTLDGIIGGRRIMSFSIKCNQINDSGVLATALFHVTPQLQRTIMTSAEPTLDEVYSGLFTDFTLNTLATKVVIGSHLVWLITTAYGRIYPVRCTAYEGKVIDLQKPNRNIIENGCSLDEELVGDFNNSNPGSIVASFYAFRFINNPYITVLCDVRVCPEGSEECDFYCPKVERRKRQADVYHRLMRRESVRVTLLVEDITSYTSTVPAFTSSIRISFMLSLLSIFWFGAVC